VNYSTLVRLKQTLALLEEGVDLDVRKILIDVIKTLLAEVGSG